MPRFAIRAMIACIACLILFSVDNNTEAQIFRRTVRPQQYYAHPQPVHYSHPGVVISHQGCDQHKPQPKPHHGCKKKHCNGGCGHCHCNPPCPDPNCCENICDCKPKITPSQGCETVECKKFKIEPPKCCDETKIFIPFYEKKYHYSQGKVETPVKVCRVVESYRFEKKTFEICGCKLTVCIPCEIVLKKTNRCEMKLTEVKLEARIRTRPGAPRRADIWVHNVRGLPSIAVVATNVTAAQANKMFGSNFSY